jgi:hypothetical protein
VQLTVNYHNNLVISPDDTSFPQKVIELSTLMITAGIGTGHYPLSGA